MPRQWQAALPLAPHQDRGGERWEEAHRCENGLDPPRPGEEVPLTLPLFESGEDLPATQSFAPNERHRPETTIEDLILQVYWSAGWHAHALAAAARREGSSARERWALRRLTGVEEERKELAGQLLKELWNVRLVA